MNVIDIRTGQPLTVATSTVSAVATRLAVGCTFENGTLRTHRYRDLFVVWDLTNAGKRGKKVAQLTLSPAYVGTAAQRDSILDQMGLWLEQQQSYAVALAALTFAATSTELLDLHTNEVRGVDVAPPAFKTITIETPILKLEASYKNFSIHCLIDKHNHPGAAPRAKKASKAISQFYAWVSANQSHIETLSFRDVLSAMDELGIDYHSYCAS